MKKILITGSSGFLGSRLAYYLKEKYELLLPSHQNLMLAVKKLSGLILKSIVLMWLFIVLH